MAKTVAQKLFIRDGYRVLFLNAPEDYGEVLGELPPDVAVETGPGGEPFDLIQAFVASSGELDKVVTGMEAQLVEGGLLWITYPKKTSGVETNLDRDFIWHAVEPLGWKAVAMIAVDDVWSAMRFKRV